MKVKYTFAVVLPILLVVGNSSREILISSYIPGNRNTSAVLTSTMLATYECGFENSCNVNIGSNEAYSNRRRIETELIRTGSYAVRHELRKDDPPVAGSLRCESHTEDMITYRIHPGQIWYYGFSVYIPSTWVTDGPSDDILFQWKGFGGPPFLFITQKHEGFYLRINYDTNEQWSENTIIGEQRTIVGSLAKGKWHDFRIRVVWEYEDNGGTRTS